MGSSASTCPGEVNAMSCVGHTSLESEIRH